VNAAAEAFSVRRVFGFGDHLPDGMTPLCIDTSSKPSTPAFPKQDALKPAIITFDMTPEGMLAVPRNHVQLIAGGLSIMLESAIAADSNILSSIAPSSFGGLAASLAMWLLTGRSLALHHPGDLQVLEQQIASPHYDALIVPAPLASRLCELDAFSKQSSLSHVVGLWRSPERHASGAAWPNRKARLTDVLVFGEIGLLAANRAESGEPAPILVGQQTAPRDSANGKVVGELSVTPAGTLALRGAMVPLAAYRRGVDPNERDQATDTGYAARARRDGQIEIDAPPRGLVSVGGYRFRQLDLDDWSKRLGGDATLTALPDQMNGQRLAGSAADTRRVREVLGELGLNPLMVEAFRSRA
jgi:hypothetical protein